MSVQEGKIRNRLDLLVHLLDTTTGLIVTERNIQFRRNGKLVRVQSRGSGIYLLVNQGRENGLMQIEARGYEPCCIRIDYEALDGRLPAVDAFLIPSENLRPGVSFFTLSGHLEQITGICAIHLARPLSGIREFDARRRIMTVYMPNRRMNMASVCYSLYHASEGTFEEFVVDEEIDGKRIRIKEPLKEPFSTNAPICRTIFGQTDGEGNYLLRVRDGEENQKHLVKYIVGGDVRYRMVDFHELTEVQLE